MKKVAIVQARMGSSRLPGKVLKKINGKSLIEILLKRLSKATKLDKIIVATSNHSNNDHLQKTVKKLGFSCTRGSEDNVLKRFYQTAKLVKADIIIRITGDCPLIDAGLVDKCVNSFEQGNFDYYSNIDPPTFPDGLDVEVFSFKALEKAYHSSLSKFDKEHVTTYIRNSNFFVKSSFKNPKNFSEFRWTVDEIEDFNVVERIFKHFHPNIYFSWFDVLELQKQNPRLFEENKSIMNNEGAIMGKGQKLYKRAKKIIPGGNMLLSKRPEMFLPDKWPSYFSKSKGCEVWDLDGNKFVDMSIMGIGTNILGYGCPEVDEAVAKTIKDGNMSTFNCPEEVFLAEKLIDLHPWASMARFARTGGEINSIAIRIARAFTRKEKIAICGYHGWHDWYLSTNLNNDKNLDGHLLPGLEPNGVPRGLTGTTIPFKYNKIEELEDLIYLNKDSIAAIMMEVSRNQGPNKDFLNNVKKLANKHNIILIFDECTTGFRETLGGIHKKYDVDPDMAIFAKALGNGYAISACIGSKELMQATQNTFISSTFWTERIGPTAALKTLEIMREKKSWEKITQVGKIIRTKWRKLAEKYELDIDIWGIPALSGFNFRSPNALAYKTIITQEMLKKGYLAANSVYVCTEHSSKIIDSYFEELDPIFSIIKKCEDGLDIGSVLKSPICHSGFKRLN